jgi:myo-inositol 2-dehydrogenase / D-chiro-inositol 1-dehydrogenase
MSERMRIALAGFGAWGKMHARAVQEIDASALVAVFCHSDTSDEAARQSLPDVPRFRSYQAMLDAGGFDAVIVAVPNNLHAAFAIAALEAGYHVLLEKPLGLTLGECDSVIAAAALCGRHVAVNHELRVSHQWGRVRELIAAGNIGRVTHQHFSLFRHGFRRGSGGWRYDRERVGSWILEELVHFVDLVLWYARENGSPAHLSATASAANGLADTVSVVLEWANGSTALVTQCLAGFQHHTLLEVAGDAGAVRTWWAGIADRTATPEFAMSVWRRGTDLVEAVEIPRSGEIFELEENIRQALDGFRSGHLVIPLEDARAAVALCLAIETSITTGKRVNLSDILGGAAERARPIDDPCATKAG